MRVGSLFSGIGGLELGLERAGMETVWQVEQDPYALAVLKKHWPNVRRHTDVRTFPPPEGDWSCDLICGGFPCQDVSLAGKRAGLKKGNRSGLWIEFARIIRALRPRFVVVENVPGLLSDGLGRVLGDLAESGYDAGWDCIGADDVGAPHIRKRVFIVAHAQSLGRGEGGAESDPRRKAIVVSNRPHVADAAVRGRDDASSQETGEYQESAQAASSGSSEQAGGCGVTQQGADSDLSGLQKRQRQDAAGARENGWAIAGRSEWWDSEPDVGRVAHGIPSRVDRLRCLGNAVVPQVAEVIGRMIMQSQGPVGKGGKP